MSVADVKDILGLDVVGVVPESAGRAVGLERRHAR